MTVSIVKGELKGEWCKRSGCRAGVEDTLQIMVEISSLALFYGIMPPCLRCGPEASETRQQPELCFYANELACARKEDF